uniref:Coiled-coil domain containing 60 n=1 Tax=Rousettus aegyptiacus TaxID=9407 RepID=A0A7J8GXW0_ROUAE|nr:coiled-coil domain containing 60 [Rousettus aegyptiacus]
MRAGVIFRPFTPIHSCIISPSLPEAHVEPLFRQLCALHWLLEALTIDHTHHTMKPLITCWNPKDPGGSKSTIKKIIKDKSMGQRWEQFVTGPKVTDGTRRHCLATGPDLRGRPFCQSSLRRHSAFSSWFSE